MVTPETARTLGDFPTRKAGVARGSVHLRRGGASDGPEQNRMNRVNVLTINYLPAASALCCSVSPPGSDGLKIIHTCVGRGPAHVRDMVGRLDHPSPGNHTHSSVPIR